MRNPNGVKLQNRMEHTFCPDSSSKLVVFIIFYHFRSDMLLYINKIVFASLWFYYFKQDMSIWIILMRA